MKKDLYNLSVKEFVNYLLPQKPEKMFPEIFPPNKMYFGRKYKFDNIAEVYRYGLLGHFMTRLELDIDKVDVINYIYQKTDGFNPTLLKAFYDDFNKHWDEYIEYEYPYFVDTWGREVLTILDDNGEELEIYFDKDKGIMIANSNDLYDIFSRKEFKENNIVVDSESEKLLYQKSFMETSLFYHFFNNRAPLFGYVCKFLEDKIAEFTIDESSNISEKAVESKQIPEKLMIPEAQKWMNKAVCLGLLNEDYSPTKLLETRPQKAYFADRFSEKVWNSKCYAPFEKLWGIQGLAKARWNTIEIVGKVRGQGPIDNLFDSCE